MVTGDTRGTQSIGLYIVLSLYDVTQPKVNDKTMNYLRIVNAVVNPQSR